MKGKKRKIMAMIAGLLTVVMVVAMLLPSNETYASEKVSDITTETKYKESLGDNASTEYAGRIWSDKSVFSEDATFDLYGGGSATISNDSDFLVAYSVLATADAVQGQTQAPVDVVFVIDISGSMSNSASEMDNGYSRIYNTVQALNTSIDEVMNMNEYTRVAVVAFSNTATTLLPLGRYTKATSWGSSVDYFTLNRTEASSQTVTLYTNAVNESNRTISRTTNVTGGTNIQHGLYQGLSILANETTTTANIEGSVVNRVPSLILLSDGAPTYSSSSSNWWEPAANNSDGPGNSAYYGNGMKALMTGAYMKDEIGRNYAFDATVYTVGMGISDLSNEVWQTGGIFGGWQQVYTGERDLAYATLNPDENWDETNDMISAIKAAWATYTTNDGRPTVDTDSGEEYTFTHPSANDIDTDVDALRNFVDDYYDADSASAVTNVFEQIMANISISSPQVPTELKGSDPLTDGYITYTDPIGEYMEVKDIKEVIYAGQRFPVKTTTTTLSGTTTNYVFEGEVHSPVYGEQNIDDIIIQVNTADDGNQTLTVKIPASVIPVRVNTVTLNENGTVNTHVNNGAFPTRVLYTVGLRDDLMQDGVVQMSKLSDEYIKKNSNSDGTINFYSNLYTGKTVEGHDHTIGDATVEFEPAHTNHFYYMQENVPIYLDSAGNAQVTSSVPLDDNTTYYYIDEYYHGTEVVEEIIPRTGAQLKKTDIISIGGYWYRAAGSPRLNRILEFEGKKIENATNTAEAFYVPTFEYAEDSTDPYAGKYVVYLGNNGVIGYAASGTLEIKKIVETEEGVTAPDRNFEFTVNFNGSSVLGGTYDYDILNANGEESGTGTITDGGRLYLKAGETARIHNLAPDATYTVEETAVAGFTTTATGASGTIQVGTTSTATFTNRYEVNPVTVPASEGFAGTKTLDGRDWVGSDSFTFIMESRLLTTPMPAGSFQVGDTHMAKEVTVANDAAKDGEAVAFDFGSITYTVPGEWEYIISEKAPEGQYIPGVSYSGAMYLMTVSVADDGLGNLSATYVMEQIADHEGLDITPISGTSADFVNEFRTDSVNWMPVGTKSYRDTTTQKPLTSGMFQFKMEAVTAGAPMPVNATNGELIVANADAQIVYEAVTFTQAHAGPTEAEANEYVYRFTEVIPATPERGMTYDTNSYDVTVRVYLSDEGQIVVDPQYPENAEAFPNGSPSRLVFFNEYNPAPATATIGGEKTLVGRDMKAGEAFRFAYGVNEQTGYALRNGYFTVDTNKLEVTVSGGLDGQAMAFDFGQMTFYRPGTYRFMIREIEGTEPGVTYDTEDSGVTIEVVDNSGQLEATVTYDEGTTAVIVNEYEATFDESTAVNLGGTKTLTGMPLEAGQFYFVVRDTVAGTNRYASAQADGTINLLENVTYTEAGTYVYDIYEYIPNSKVNGMTYDETKYRLTVQVVDDLNGRLYVEETTLEVGDDAGVWSAASEVSFRNTYEPTPYVHTMRPLRKVVEGFGGTLMDITAFDPFEFEMTLVNADPADGIRLPANTTISADADGNISFGDITFTKAGSYTIKIAEVGAGTTKDGVTFATSETIITYRVTDDRAGSLAVAVAQETGGFVFRNTYASSGDLKLTMEKELAGRAWTDSDRFSFEVVILDPATQEAVDKGAVVFPQNNGEIAVYDVTKAQQSVESEAIMFHQAGTYKFVVREVTGTIPGVSYDSDPRTVVVTATDDYDGTLDIAWAIEEAGRTLTFTNEYDPTSVQLSGHDHLAITKNFTGRENDEWLDTDAFTYTLSAGDATTETAVTNGDVEMNSTSLTITNDNKAHAHFRNIVFHKEGTYRFVVTENPSGIAGVIDDADTDRVVVVEVTDNGEGLLLAEKTSESEELTFNNRYLVTEVALEGATNLKVTKDLTGRNWFAADAFTFTLEAYSNIAKDAVAAGEIILPANASGIEITEADNGEKAFGDIIFKKKGVYSFVIKEVAGNAEGMTYDSHEAVIIVTVTDNQAGALVVAVPTYLGSMTFENVFTPDPVTAVLAGTKVLEGRALNASDRFRFYIEVAEGSPSNTPLPANRTIRNNGANVAFGTMVYTEAGTYKYVIREVEGTIPGIGYDEGIVTATVEVTYDAAVGELQSDVSYEKTGGNAGTGFTFTNTYETTPTDEIAFTATKKVEATNGNAYVMYGGEFEFEILAGAANPSGDPIGNRLVAQNDEFGHVSFITNATYTEEGTYVYDVREVDNGKNGIIYDNSVYTITVTVTDNEQDAKLEATVEIKKGQEVVNEITFNNGYNPAVTTVVLGGQKVLDSEHKNLEAGEFTFRLEAVDNAPLPTETEVTNEASGIFNFGTITYESTGTYWYKISEVQGNERGYTYDSSVYEVRVVVTDEGFDGTLDAVVRGMANVVFTNGYEPAGTQATIRGTKTLEGRPLNADEFEFTLYDITGKEIDSVKNAADGTFAFENLAFTKAGSYRYTIVEKNTNLGGVTYDTNTFEAEITVEDKGGYLEATVAQTVEIAFVNNYKAAPTSIQLGATKKMTGRKLEADEFTFILEDENGNEWYATNAEDGTILFEELEYTEAGTYVYTIREKAGKAKRVTYDDSIYTVTVEVEDDLEGHLTASVKAKEAKIVFENTYTPKEKPEKPVEPISPRTGEFGSNNTWLILTFALLAGASLIIALKKREER